MGDSLFVSQLPAAIGCNPTDGMPTGLNKSQFNPTDGMPTGLNKSQFILFSAAPGHTPQQGLDLFSDIVPEDRSCADAGIPAEYCAATEPVELAEAELAAQASTILR